MKWRQRLWSPCGFFSARLTFFSNMPEHGSLKLRRLSQVACNIPVSQAEACAMALPVGLVNDWRQLPFPWPDFGFLRQSSGVFLEWCEQGWDTLVARRSIQLTQICKLQSLADSSNLEMVVFSKVTKLVGWILVVAPKEGKAYFNAKFSSLRKDTNAPTKYAANSWTMLARSDQVDLWHRPTTKI